MSLTTASSSKTTSFAPSSTSWHESGRYDERRRAIDAVECRRRHDPSRPGADAGEVRHLLQRDVLQPAGALVNVYTDGTVLLNHGGTEMGQGLHTRSRKWSPPSLACRCRHIGSDDDRHVQSAEHLRDGGVIGFGSQRQGGAGCARKPSAIDSSNGRAAPTAFIRIRCTSWTAMSTSDPGASRSASSCDRRTRPESRSRRLVITARRRFTGTGPRFRDDRSFISRMGQP